MSGFVILIAVLVVLTIAYQIYVSRRVARAPDYTDQQRLLQLIMIWTLPIIGAALCQTMLSNSEAAEVTDEGCDNHAPDDHSAEDD